MKKVISIIGARPNLVKAGVVHQVLSKFPRVYHEVWHTGQHSSSIMNDVLSPNLRLPIYKNLNLSSTGTNSNYLEELSNALFSSLPRDFDLYIVYGDVYSTLAATKSVKRFGGRLLHIESGLRQPEGCQTIPEEGIRVEVDSLCDHHWASDYLGELHVAAIPDNLQPNPMYNGKLLLTLHRNNLVDNEDRLNNLITTIARQFKTRDIIFPKHPRTNLTSYPINIHIIKPLSRWHFLSALAACAGVMTDSGGVPVESLALGVPTLVLRDGVERKYFQDCSGFLLQGPDLKSALSTFEVMLNRTTTASFNLPIFNQRTILNNLYLSFANILGLPAIHESI